MMAPSVFKRTKSPQAPAQIVHKLQNGAAEYAESELAEGAEGGEGAETSPGNSISDESFECVGEANGDRRNGDAGNRSPGGINRHSWTRTSLRRTPSSPQDNLPHRRWGSMRHSGKRQQQLGSNVLASQLYRSSSFNSSGCGSAAGSAGEPADDMYSDVSLEEDVQGLNYKVQLLQQQVTSLADTQSTSDDRYARAKADNAVLQTRIHMLDEQIREIECRCQTQLEDEKKRCRDAISRVERDRDQQISALTERLGAAEGEASDLKQEVGRLRGVAEGLRMGAEAEARRFQDAQAHISELTLQLQQARDQERKRREMNTSDSELISELQAEVERLRREQTCAALPTTQPDLLRLEELHRELTDLRKENKKLCEAQEELQAQILTRGIEEGRSLLDGVSGPLITVAQQSLAHELQHMSQDQLDGCEAHEQAIQLEKVQRSLQEQQDVNVQLRTYIDGILLSIVEHYPQLLDVKYQKRPPS